MEKITAARAGERHPFPVAGSDREVTLEVLPPCPVDRGHWACVTHREGFGTQLQKDFHISRGTHHLVWICFEHGPEQPA